MDSRRHQNNTYALRKRLLNTLPETRSLPEEESKETEERHPSNPPVPRTLEMARPWLNKLRSWLEYPLSEETATLPLDAVQATWRMMDGTPDGFFRTVQEAAQLQRDNHSIDPVQWPFGEKSKIVLVTDPEHIEQLYRQDMILQSDGTAIKSGTGFFEFGFGGKTLFSLSPDDPRWEEARSHARHNLITDETLQTRLPIIHETIDKWLDKIEPGKPLPMYHFVHSLALDVIARTQLFANDLTDEGIDRVSDIITRIMDRMPLPGTRIGLMLKDMGLPDFLNCPLAPILALLREGQQVIKEELLDRSGNANVRSDILKHWLNQGAGESDIHTTIKMIAVGGHETVAKKMFFYIMAIAHPDHADVYEKLMAEIMSKGPIEKLEDYKNLPWVNAVGKEILRLYSPIPIMLRNIKKEGVAGNTRLNPGDMVALASYLTQTLESEFPHANTFMPERFIDNGNRSKCSFFPFGPPLPMNRAKCPGEFFATLENNAFIVRALKRFIPTANLKVSHLTDYTQEITLKVKKEIEENACITFTPHPSQTLKLI